MEWAPGGRLQPVGSGRCLPGCGACGRVCPFADGIPDETELAAGRFGAVPGIRHSPELGYYLAAFAGHARGGYRERGASGGLASWFLASLLEQGLVDRVVCVRGQADPARRFAYAVLDRPDAVRAAASSAYYPVDLAGAVRTMLDEEARYAVIGLPCFIKALHLAFRVRPRLRERVPFLAGLVCGQLKSRCFCESLVAALGLDPDSVEALTFRGKQVGLPATELLFRAEARGRTAVLPWSGCYGAAWSSGEFSLKACDYCDDVFAETADAVFMDAWLPEYAADGRGTSLVVARSPEALQHLEAGRAQGALALQPMEAARVAASQADVLAQKRDLLRRRLWLASRAGAAAPRNRVDAVRPSWLERRLIRAREAVRVESAAAWLGAGGSRAAYDRQLAPLRRRWARLAAWVGRIRRVRRLVRRLANRFRRP